MVFKDFTIVKNPGKYEISNIDVTETRPRSIHKSNDYFMLFDFSAKWDHIPTILCQNHVRLVKGFMGQTTAFNKDLIQSNVIIMGENKAANEARYIHGEFGKRVLDFLRRSRP